MESPLTPEQIEMLNTPLRPDEIEHKQGMSYLKGQLAVVKANQIFGIGNWSYKQIGTIEITESATKNSKDNSIYLVSVMVELTVRGCETFVEQGDCEAQGMGASSLSMARKGAVTDGLKRCLKNFGPAFGLDLYFNTAPSPAAFQSRPTQATRPATTQNSPTPSARPAQAPAAPQQPAKPSQPVTPPAPIVSVENDPNFKHYKEKIQAAGTTTELSNLGPVIRKQVVDQAVVVALRLEYDKRMDALVEIAHAEIEPFMAGKK